MSKLEPSQPASLMETYYYPCDEVINYEKTLIKHSIVWDYANYHYVMNHRLRNGKNH